MCKGVRPSLLAGLPLLLAFAVGLADRRAQSQDFPVAWRTDFASAREEAKAQRKPLFVVFR